MFIVKYANSCLTEYPNETSTFYTDKNNQIYTTVLIAMATLAFIFNGFSLVILTRKNSNLRFGQIKLNLFLLSLVETGLNGFITIFQLIIQNKNTPNFGGIVYIWIDTILFYNIISLTCTRNWIVVIIACSRCEIIFVPFNSRRGLKFNNRNTKIIAVVILMFSYCLSFARLFSKQAVVCQDIPMHIQIPFLLTLPQYKYFEIYVFFIYQSVLPVLIVAIVSLSMSASLLRSSRRSTNSTNSQNCSYFRIKSTPDQRISSRKINSQRKATRTILVLAMVFTLLEVPVFIIQSIIQLTPHIYLAENPQLRKTFSDVCNLLVVLDSCSNIVVYLLTSDKFRLEVRRIFWQINSCQICDENNSLSATEHLVVHQNNVLALLSALPLSSRSNPSH